PRRGARTRARPARSVGWCPRSDSNSVRNDRTEVLEVRSHGPALERRGPVETADAGRASKPLLASRGVDLVVRAGPTLAGPHVRRDQAIEIVEALVGHDHDVAAVTALPSARLSTSTARSRHEP